MIAIDREKLAAAAEALGMDKDAAVGSILGRLAKKFGGGYAAQAAKQATPVAPGIMSKLKSLGLKLGLLGGAGAGLYHLGKQEGGRRAAPMPMPMPMMGPGGGGFDPTERMQFARHGLDPERLKFMQTLSNLRSGMNLEQKMFQQAMAGKLPANVLGGGEDEGENLEAYA
jgi:hypothetical protein